MTHHYPEPTIVKWKDQDGKISDVLFCNACERFVCICAQMEDKNFATNRYLSGRDKALLRASEAIKPKG